MPEEKNVLTEQHTYIFYCFIASQSHWRLKNPAKAKLICLGGFFMYVGVTHI